MPLTKVTYSMIEGAPVNVLDYGADPTGTDDSSVAIQAATDTGLPVFFPAGTYKANGITYTGTVVWSSNGDATILSDSAVLTVTDGSDSIIDNLNLENITAPWIITRDPSNWSAVPTPVQSNNNGYQPTVNDADVWSSLTTEQKNQNIGPQIIFNGDASNIQVSRITGRFVSVLIYDAQDSVVRDCNFRAGKNFVGGIVFWNIDNQQGERNAAINNVISYASYNGIIFARNYDGLTEGNMVSYCGESGIKTYQNTTGGIDYRCYRMKIANNDSLFEYYDGFDLSSDYPHLGTSDSRHNIIGNSTYGNNGTGFYADGKLNQFIANQARKCQKSGIYLTYNYSQINSNFAKDNNFAEAVSGQNQLNIVGDNNTINDNYISQDSVINGYCIYATGNNLVSGNYADKSIFLGTANNVTSTQIGNVSSNYSVQGTFTPTISVGGTLQSTNIAIGKYTKVGKRVYFDIVLQMNAAPSGGGNIDILFNTLPGSDNTSSYASALSIATENVTYSNTPIASVGAASVGLIVGSASSGGTIARWTQANLTSTSKFIISGSYLANI